MAFTKKQRAFFKKANCRWNIKAGATRSGKTYMDYFLIPMRIRQVAGKDGLVVILGNTKGTLQRNIIDPLKAIWGEAFVSDIRADNVAYLFGEKVYCLGADKVSHVDRLRGASIKYCYGDEIATWHEDVFQMLKSRLDKPYSRFDGTCNPEAPNHWLKQFIDGAKEKGIDLFYQEYSIYDNSFLPRKLIRNLEREYGGSVFFDRFILGKWVGAEGLIYPQFSPEKHLVDWQTPEVDLGEYYISVDYGTQNPCAMGLWRVEEGNAVRVREFYHDGRALGRQKTDEEYYEALLALAGDFPITAVLVDPSAASFIACIKKHGRFHVRRAKNAVADGIRVTASLLLEGRLRFDQSCTAIQKEFANYCWDKASGEDKPVKEHDHAMDDMRYFCYTILRN